MFKKKWKRLTTTTHWYTHVRLLLTVVEGCPHLAEAGTGEEVDPSELGLTFSIRSKIVAWWTIIGVVFVIERRRSDGPVTHIHVG
jgi:hypothetical protein